MPAANQDPSLARAERAFARGRAHEAEEICARHVGESPKNAAAWNLLGLARQKLGQLSGALAAFNKAAALDRNNAHYQHDLGNALAEDRKLDRAITAYRRALRLDDTLAEVHNDLGTAYFEKQWYEQAEHCFRRAVRLRPEHGVAYANLGAALRAQGRLHEGRKAFQRALILKLRGILPRFLRWNVGGAVAGAHAAELQTLRESIGKALAQQKLDDAKKLADHGVSRFPGDAEVAYVAVEVFDRLGETEPALAHARRAVQQDPQNGTYRIALAKLLLRRHDHAGALEAAQAATRLEPDSADAHAILSTVYRASARSDLAERAALRAIELDPQSADGHDDLAMALWSQQRLIGAEAAGRDAVRLAPHEPRYRINLAIVLKDAGRVREARELYRELSAELSRHPAVFGFMCQNLGTLALECAGDLESARRWFRKAADAGEPDRAALSESVADLLEGRFDVGWEKFEARKRVPGQRERHDLFARFAPWDGAPLNGKRLLVYGEQGIGDEIMFASMLRELSRRAPEITLLCDPRLQQLFSRSFPAIEVLRAAYETLPTLQGRVACAVASGSLGQHFRRSVADFPARAGYLQTDAAKVKSWSERLHELGAGRKIGLSWVGGLQHTGLNRRSLSLEQMQSVLATPGVQWISLQHGDVAREMAVFTAKTGIAVHGFPDVTNDMDDLASLVQALDLVITVSNTTVHVAGALGKPLLVMAPFVPLWIYGIGGERIPWYPSARVFRQGHDGNWDDVLDRVRAAVAASHST